jgi:hypothetical protein
MSPSVTSATLSPGTNVPTSGDVDIPATTSMLPAPREELTGITDSTPPLENADTPSGNGKKRKRVVETSLADLPLSLTSPQAALWLWNLCSLFAGGGSNLFDTLVFLSWWSLAVLSTKQGQESAMQGLAAAIGDIEGLLRKVVLPPFNVDHYEGGNTKRMRKN